jgi:hypothetical protein
VRIMHVYSVCKDRNVERDVAGAAMGASDDVFCTCKEERFERTDTDAVLRLMTRNECSSYMYADRRCYGCDTRCMQGMEGGDMGQEI